MRTWLLPALMLCATVAVAETLLTRTFQVRSQPAAAMLDVVRPLLGDNGGVSAFHDKLIVRGTPAQIEAVGSLLGELDRPARRLVIELRQAGSAALSGRDAGYGIDTGNVRIGQPTGDGHAGAYYREIQTRGSTDGMQRVQALDGRPALIRAGQSVPVYQAHQQVIGNQIVQGFQMQYRDTGSGFFALPRVHGDQVTVEIYQQHERPGPGGAFDIQQAATVLRGALGQWLPLGGFSDSDSDRRDALGRHVQTRRSADSRLELRVTTLD